jgi:hypothetical protein
MWMFNDIVQREGKGKLNLEMSFTHDKGGGVWTIKYKLRKREGKYTNLFNIYAPNRQTPRREHRLDTVMLVIKNCAFHDRHNTTGYIGFKTFKLRLSEVVGMENANRVAFMFADRIKEEVSAKA